MSNNEKENHDIATPIMNLIDFINLLTEEIDPVEKKYFTKNSFIKKMEQKATKKDQKFNPNKITRLIDSVQYMKKKNFPFLFHLNKNENSSGQEITYTLSCDNYSLFFEGDQFDEEEAIQLTDALYTANHIPENVKSKLYKKIEFLTLNETGFKADQLTKYMISYDKRRKDIDTYNLYNIYRAIDEKKRLSFTYNQYNVDGELEPSNKNTRKVVNPFNILIKNSHYYLYCTYPNLNDERFLRIDKMTDIEVTKEKADTSPTEHLKENKRINQIHMFGGKTKRIRFRCHKDGNKMISQLMDHFNKEHDLEIKELDDEYIHVTLQASLWDIRYWMLQYITVIDQIEPDDLKEIVMNDLKNALERNE